MKTIMIVDDSPTMLMSLEGMLSKGGFSIIKANSGEQAYEMLKGGQKPALIITDLNMGTMNGIALISSVRKQPGFQFVRRLMLTTESQQEKRSEAKAAGATGWLVKPVQPDALMGVIKQVVPGA